MLYLSGRVLTAATGGKASIYKYYFVQQKVRNEPVLAPHRGRKIEVVELKAGDSRLMQLPRPASVIAARFRQGGRCLAGFVGDVFVGCLWFNFGPYREDEVRSVFVPEPVGLSCWDYDVYIEPRYRLGFAFLRLWDEANRVLVSQGVRWSISRISAFNPDSIKSHESMGAGRLGSAVYLCVGGAQLMLSTFAPFVHLSFNGGREPVLRIRAQER